MYEVNGSLWVRIQWSGTEPMWAACGFYSVEKCSRSGRIFVKCLLVKDPAEFTKAIYLNDPGPFDVVSQNFSLNSAHIQTAQDTYVLKHLFPILSRRSLQRRMSEELGARTPQGPQADDAPDAAAPSVPRPQKPRASVPEAAMADDAPDAGASEPPPPNDDVPPGGGEAAGP